VKNFVRVLVFAVVAAMMLSCVAFAEAPAHDNSLIYGSTTEISGDWGRALWTNNASDNLIRNLIDDYNTVTTNQGGEFVVNESVVANYETAENEDGSKTYTITLNDGLLWNDGTPITVQDFVAEALFVCNKTSADLGAKSTLSNKVLGGRAYYNGEADTLAGLRILDDKTFSITIVAVDEEDDTVSYLPYFYDMTYAAFYPMNVKFWFGEDMDIADDGEGCYFTSEFTADTVGAAVENARFYSDNRISAGPYTLVSFDKGSLQATLEINPYYAGNFEGQKPSIEKIVIVKAEDTTWADAMKTGAIEFYDTITDGTEVNTAMDMIDEGGFDYVSFGRAGYGKIMFQCDFGPTQFLAVRQAIAMMLDRNEFANTFCNGWGGVVNGPYGTGMWMFQDSEEFFDENLNTYDYDAQGAIDLLVEDGWVYAEDGSDYVEGVRYKKVTEEEAGNYQHNVTLEDGTILMPLIIEWSSSEGNSVSDLLAVMLAQNEDVANAGMVINQNIMTFSELLNYMYRDASQGDQYGVPTYGMYNLATNFSAAYDQSYSWTSDPDYVAQGFNTNYLFDDELDKLSMDMVYGVSPDDPDTYLDIWQKYVVRWNELLPEVPLYSNIYVSVFPDWLENYEQDSYWDFYQAIVYANVAGYGE
jgi:peptide/nickel transport system substrate-binding protein